MTKPNDKNDDRYKALGFESAFDGTATGIQWSELVEGLKTNVLRQNLRVRKFVMGEYDTKSVGDRDLAKVPNPLPGDWDATVKRQVSLVLQPERKATSYFTSLKKLQQTTQYIRLISETVQCSSWCRKTLYYV